MAARLALDEVVGVQIPGAQYSSRLRQRQLAARLARPPALLPSQAMKSNSDRNATRTVWGTLAVLVSASAILVGCGDNSPETTLPITAVSTETQATEALSKTAFIAEADARCAETNAAVQQYVDAGEGFSGAAEIADLRQGLLDQLKELGPPTEDRATLDEFLTGLESQVEAGQKIGLALDRGTDTATYETALTTARTDAETAAAAYGFKECGTSKTSTTTTGSSVSTGGSSTPTYVAPTGGGTSGGGTSGGGGGGGGGIAPP